MESGFRYRHWTGFRSRTHPFGLAASCVFIKQPGPPCHCDLRPQPSGQGHRHPLSLSYGANLPSSLAWSAPTRLGLLTLGTCVGSGYGCGGSFPAHFSRSPGIGRTPLCGRLFLLSPDSHHYGTPQAYTVKQGDGPARPTPKRRARGLCRHTYPRSTGILTCFPFDQPC